MLLIHGTLPTLYNAHTDLVYIFLIVHVFGALMWHHDDVDSVHVERIGISGDQLLKNVRCGNFCGHHRLYHFCTCPLMFG
jgi:hypothetical protein